MTPYFNELAMSLHSSFCMGKLLEMSAHIAQEKECGEGFLDKVYLFRFGLLFLAVS